MLQLICDFSPFHLLDTLYSYRFQLEVKTTYIPCYINLMWLLLEPGKYFIEDNSPIYCWRSEPSIWLLKILGEHL